MKTKGKNELVISGNIAHPTAADRLIAYLSNTSTILFICLFAEFNSGLLTIKTRRKSANSEEIKGFNKDLGDDLENPAAYTMSVSGNLRGNLTHSLSGNI